MMKNNSFVALILTHGRPDNVHTIKTLRKCGYTGDIIIVLDNEDPKINRYRKNYENIYVFDKKKGFPSFYKETLFSDIFTFRWLNSRSQTASADIPKSGWPFLQ